ncbi:type IV toxin-antitoxin system AbiEi family antitoxin domain-containing protein [Mumia quercus]|uniref:type IV toxin-antitoxin system AbiEi family antitoxin domain-containing protein n=1 Tax=Mumia quercus TaxID=2976125 RepID=UPI0021CF6061|nr:type IV toxin-antitoxin system AbiEi family antitoxin domain-containing protein [Mumia quercus]
MDDVTALAESQGGYVTRGQLRSLGSSDFGIAKAVRAGLLRKVRHGTYAPAATYDRLEGDDRYRVNVRAVLDKLGPEYVASHRSSCAVHRFGTFRVTNDEVDVTRRGGTRGRIEAGVRFHHGTVRDEDVIVVDGLPVTEPLRASIETTTLPTLRRDVEAGVVLLSEGMRLSGTTREQVVTLLDDRFGSWPSTSLARIAVTIADGRCETVGESRSLYLFARHKLPVPELQVWVRLPDGTLARVDFLWLQHRTFGEFDGAVKYALGDAAEPRRALYDEKLREDALRSYAMGAARWGWVDLDGSRSASTARRIAATLEQSVRLYGKSRIEIPVVDPAALDQSVVSAEVLAATRRLESLTAG